MISQDKKDKIILKSISAGYVLLAALVIGMLALIFNSSFIFGNEKEAIKQMRDYQQNYIAQNPNMIPVINKYSECKYKEYKQYAVVEGCVKHASANQLDEKNLENYIQNSKKTYYKAL